MSIWTHVNASIRIDIANSDTIQHIIDNLPCGSEGPLNYQLWENPHRSYIASYTLNIFGDLRDYNDNQVLIDWFKDICNALLMFRSAIIEIDNESNPYVILFRAQQKGLDKDIIYSQYLVDKNNGEQWVNERLNQSHEDIQNAIGL